MKKWIICTGPDWFRPSVTSTRQIMFHFLKDGYHILWVNPVAFKSPAVNSENRKSMYKKIKNKFKTHLKLFKREDERIYILIPFYIPIFNSFYDKINSYLIKYQVKIASLILGIRWNETLLWISGNFTLSPLLNYNFKSKVYQAADLISDFRTTDKALLNRLKQKETILSQSVNYRFASSPKIKQKLEKLSNTEVHLLTHGVDFDHFTKKQKLHPFIEGIRNKGLPIAGYFGTLSDANDKEVFMKLANNGYSVVIIGKVLGDYSELEGKKNIYFAGPVEFSQLPSYAQGFDVCLLNWIMADWIKNSFPVKTLEYLAMGKPIVSCRIPVVEELFGSLVYFANTPEEFLQQADKCIKENCTVYEEMRINEASKHTWEMKYAIIKGIIA
ncbi:MAG TPA: glycosyltransferase [Lentimicrobium sp.]|nr:glycosyltransferase [Lentimicrobium sp.]